jgi:hypothetical protein
MSTTGATLQSPNGSKRPITASPTKAALDTKQSNKRALPPRDVLPRAKKAKVEAPEVSRSQTRYCARKTRLEARSAHRQSPDRPQRPPSSRLRRFHCLQCCFHFCSQVSSFAVLL